jgi:hypothetical protein
MGKVLRAFFEDDDVAFGNAIKEAVLRYTKTHGIAHGALPKKLGLPDNWVDLISGNPSARNILVAGIFLGSIFGDEHSEFGMLRYVGKCVRDERESLNNGSQQDIMVAGT